MSRRPRCHFWPPASHSTRWLTPNHLTWLRGRQANKGGSMGGPRAWPEGRQEPSDLSLSVANSNKRLRIPSLRCSHTSSNGWVKAWNGGDVEAHELPPGQPRWRSVRSARALGAGSRHQCSFRCYALLRACWASLGAFEHCHFFPWGRLGAVGGHGADPKGPHQSP